MFQPFAWVKTSAFEEINAGQEEGDSETRRCGTERRGARRDESVRRQTACLACLPAACCSDVSERPSAG